MFNTSCVHPHQLWNLFLITLILLLSFGSVYKLPYLPSFAYVFREIYLAKSFKIHQHQLVLTKEGELYPGKTSHQEHHKMPGHSECSTFSIGKQWRFLSPHHVYIKIHTLVVNCCKLDVLSVECRKGETIAAFITWCVPQRAPAVYARAVFRPCCTVWTAWV